LVQGPITVKESDLARAVLNPLRILSPKGDARPPAKESPAAISGADKEQEYKPAMQ
jgi:hypothetical protein